MLFCNHDSDHCDESWKFAGCFCKNFWGSIWIPTGSSRRFWRSPNEWNQTWTVFEWSRFRICSVCGSSGRMWPAGQSRIGTGARGICGYDRDLQLYSIYHAACAGRKSYRTFRNGSSADSNGTSSWPFWCDLYCGDAVFIQFFDVSGHPFLCEMQCCISFRR